jgi:hypothetical protein
MSRVLAKEMSYETSPAGVLTRAKDAVTDRLGGGNGSSANGD